MTTGRSDGGAARLLDAAAVALFAAHAALRLSLRGGDGSWGSNLFAHLLIPLAAGVWLTARALERKLEWRWTGLEIPLAALAALALLSTFGASFRLAAMDGAAGLCGAVLAVPLAVLAFGTGGRSALVGLLAALVAAVALYGCIEYAELGELQSRPETARLLAMADDSGELAGRLGAREPKSTLNYPNTFAGFLVLAIPFVIGAALDARSRLCAVAALLIGAAGAFGVWASGSAGAGVAAAGAGVAFAILETLRRRPAWRRPLLAATGAALVIGAALGVAGPLAERSEALAIRDVYWDAAVRVAKAHPFGVGLNNFEDYYYQHKDDRQEEVRHVHNDYLQVLAELGIPGLLAFLALTGAAAWLALKPPTEEPSAPASPFTWPVVAGLGIGWLAAFGFQGAFGDLAIALLCAAAGIGTYVAFSRREGFGVFTRIGLAAGLAGVAVHYLVDFDFQDPGFRHFFFLGIAALALTTRLEPPTPTGPVIPAAAAAVFFAIALPLAAAVAPRFLEAEEMAREADADEKLEAAGAANPLDPDPVVRHGLRMFQQGNLDLAVTILEEGLRRRPRSAGITARLAEVHEAAGLRARVHARPGIEAAAGEAHLVEAERLARRAVELYPTRADHRYLLGRILDDAGQATEAAAEFREALRLSTLAKRVPRLALDGFQKAFATQKTGGDGIALLRDWMTTQPPDRWKARRARLTPAEKAVVDAAAESK